MQLNEELFTDYMGKPELQAEWSVVLLFTCVT